MSGPNKVTHNIVQDDTLDPDVVHRVLLADEEDLPYMTTDGGTVLNRAPLRYQDFVDDHCSPSSSLDLAERISRTMRRAFLDGVRESLERGDAGPWAEMTLELHESVRSLVPRRTDLHGILSDERVRTIANGRPPSASALWEATTAIGEAAAALEAPDQAETTREWIALATDDERRRNDDVSSFVVWSTAFLHRKVETCHSDLRNVRFARAVVPALRRDDAGVRWERRRFERTHGSFATGCPGAASTREWCSSSRVGPFDPRRALVADFVFAATQRELPEVLSRDADAIHRARETARRVVAGSALELLCGATNDNDDDDDVESARQRLEEAVAAGRGRDGDELTPLMRDALIDLRRKVERRRPSSETPNNDDDVLARRATAVLRGEDAVFSLLDKRVRTLFESVVAEEEGIAVSAGVAGDTARVRERHRAIVIRRIRDRARAAGLRSFSDRSAEDLRRLRRVGQHLVRVYGEPLLNRLMDEAASTGGA